MAPPIVSNCGRQGAWLLELTELPAWTHSLNSLLPQSVLECWHRWPASKPFAQPCKTISLLLFSFTSRQFLYSAQITHWHFFIALPYLLWFTHHDIDVCLFSYRRSLPEDVIVRLQQIILHTRSGKQRPVSDSPSVRMTRDRVITTGEFKSPWRCCKDARPYGAPS